MWSGYSPAIRRSESSNPGGELCPPPDRRPFDVDADIARLLFGVLLATGVGNNGEDPITSVRGADGRSG
jgi:hypothetical protein